MNNKYSCVKGQINIRQTLFIKKNYLQVHDGARTKPYSGCKAVCTFSFCTILYSLWLDMSRNILLQVGVQ